MSFMLHSAASDGEKESSQDGERDESMLLNDLFTLKEDICACKMQEDGKYRKILSPRALSSIAQLHSLLSAFPKYSWRLFKWNFLTCEILYALRSSLFGPSLRIILQIIQEVKQVPEFYLTKKFMFFLMEKLYFKLRNRLADKFGNLGPAENGNELDDGNGRKYENHDGRYEKDDGDHERGQDYAGSRDRSRNDYSPEEILQFFTQLISIHRPLVHTLREMGLFILANSLATYDTCILYNAIFKDYFHYNKLRNMEIEGVSPEAMYEIRRKLFEPEIIFREKKIIHLKKPILKYKKGIFEEIYNECKCMKHILELNVRECLDLMLYKRMIFMNDDFDILIREKNPKALKIYRRSLEHGALPESGYLPAILQALDDKITRMDSVLSFYYFIGVFRDYKGFTEARIRSIFTCLEYQCTLECAKAEPDFAASECFTGNECLTGNACSDRPGTLEGDTKPESSAGNVCFDRPEERDTDASLNNEYFSKNTCELKSTICDDQNLMSKLNYRAYSNATGTENVKSTHARCSYVSNDDSNISLCESTFNDKIDETNKFQKEIDQIDINFCDRKRIIKLIHHLYENCDKQYFYKPSYLILLRCQLQHCEAETAFIEQYFKEFLIHISSTRNGIAKLLFPACEKKKTSRSKEDAYLDGLLDIETHPMCSDLAASEENDCKSLGEKIKLMKSKSIENTVGQLRIKGNMIESGSSDALEKLTGASED